MLRKWNSICLKPPDNPYANPCSCIFLITSIFLPYFYIAFLQTLKFIQLHYDMGLKKIIQKWIILFCCWNVAYTFFTRRKQGVLFQQDVFPFVLTFVIFELGWNQKKKKKWPSTELVVTCFNLGKFVMLGKWPICPKRPKKQDAIVLCFCALPLQQAAADAY